MIGKLYYPTAAQESIGTRRGPPAGQRAGVEVTATTGQTRRGTDKIPVAREDNIMEQEARARGAKETGFVEQSSLIYSLIYSFT